MSALDDARLALNMSAAATGFPEPSRGEILKLREAVGALIEHVARLEVLLAARGPDLR